MKAISLHQPWASLIASGEKTIETRWWRTHYRGNLLICSTKRPVFRDLPLGVALAIVDVIDCIPYKTEHARAAGFDQGTAINMVKLQRVNQLSIWSWMLDDIRRIREPFKVVGRQGFFNTEIKGVIILDRIPDRFT